MGLSVVDDRRLFEKLSLEGFQSGLSWLTILNKRENFRAAFAGFDPAAVARFTEEDVQRLLGDAGIVRHRGKIEAVINNARRALEMVDQEGSLAAFFWRHAPAPVQGGAPVSETAESRALSRELKSGAGSSSARPPCTHSCRPWAWSTTMRRAAPCAKKWRKRARPFASPEMQRARQGGLRRRGGVRVS